MPSISDSLLRAPSARVEEVHHPELSPIKAYFIAITARITILLTKCQARNWQKNGLG